MSQTLYQIYEAKTFDLVASLVVKFSEAADIINNNLIPNGYAVNPSDPKTWKYYMNLAGQYHRSDWDALALANGLSTNYVGVDLFAAIPVPLGGFVGQTIDGVEITDGMRIMLSAQTNSSQNGFYTANISSDMYLLTKLSATGAVNPGTSFIVYQGAVYGGNVVAFSTLQNGQTPFGTTNLFFTKKPAGIVVQVAQLDTNTPVNVNFTRDLLSAGTRDVSITNEYQYGSDSYNKLVALYPDFEELILGILYPVDPIIAINAEDGAVLFCGQYYRQYITEYLTNSDGSLAVDGDGNNIVSMKRPIFVKDATPGLVDLAWVEPQETEILLQIEDWIKGFLIRWHNTSYTPIDNLYFASMIGILYTMLPATIMNLRLNNCHTPRAHSYHIQEYLESNGQLAKYIPSLPLSQVLWLYRNIGYVGSNIGKQGTFKLLIDNLATPSGVPLSGYTLRHNLTELVQNIQSQNINLKSLYPSALTQRDVINFEQVGTGSDMLSVLETIQKEEPLFREQFTLEEITQMAADVSETIRTGPSDRLPTKLIESKMLDLTDHVPYPFADTLVNYWLFCAANGTYSGTIFVKHPVTGDSIALTPLSAFILAIYCYNKAYDNLALQYVPTVGARIIPRWYSAHSSSPFHAKPLAPVLPSGLNWLANTTFFNNLIDTSKLSLSTVQSMVNQGPDVNDYSYTSAIAFYSGAAKVQAQLMARYMLSAGVEDSIGRGMAEAALNSFYWFDVQCPLTSVQTSYDQWLTDANIVFPATTTPAQYKTLADDLVRHATGNTTSLINSTEALQAAVIAIMERFSSYSVQYVYSINDAPAKVVDPKPVRLSNIRSSGASLLQVKISTVDLLSVNPNPVSTAYHFDPTFNVVIGP